MSLQIACKKCSEVMNIDDETIELSKSLNVPLPNEHKECPRDAEVLPVYEVVTTVTRYPSWEAFKNPEGAATLLATFGGHVEAATFASAVDPISRESEGQWNQIRGMAAVAEDDINREEEANG